ncbi:hypothetical protein OSG_eHP34_00045 [environmental Halophage eHP-34]|nr:hypothetical protein OSG_eHP34_00045 [environmental Halophage eHP-34]
MSTTQGEHTFDTEVLVSGEEIRGYSAASQLTQGEPVGISGDYEVDASASGEGDFIGVALYDVASGEEVAIAGDDCEVRVEVSETITAGEELLPDGVGSFESVGTSAGSNGVAIAQEGAASGELVEAYIYAVQGSEA